LSLQSMLGLVPPLEMEIAQKAAAAEIAQNAAAAEGIVGANLMGVNSVNVNGVMARKARGTSCHQCKNTKALNKLAYCANLFEKRTKPEKRRCRKKYCETCLLKFYNDSFEDIISKPWICASCRGLCCCAACERNKDKGKRYKRIHAHDHTNSLYDASRMGAGFGLFGQSSVPDIQNLMSNQYATANPLYGFPSQFSSLGSNVDSQDSIVRLQNQLALAQRLEASQQNGWQQQLGYPPYMQDANNPLSLSLHQALAQQQQLQLRQLQSVQLQQQLQSEQQSDAAQAVQSAKQAAAAEIAREASPAQKESIESQNLAGGATLSSDKSKKRPREEDSEPEIKGEQTEQSQFQLDAQKFQNDSSGQYSQHIRLQQLLQSQLQMYLQQMSKSGVLMFCNNLPVL